MIKVNAIGAALGLGAQLRATSKAPRQLMESNLFDRLREKGIDCQWEAMLEEPPSDTDISPQDRWPIVRDFVQRLSEQVSKTIQKPGCPLIIGGDHAIAMGTWPGVIDALKARQKFGLLWIDAHMDAHTAETSPSDAMHGMPVAALLGHGKTAWHSSVPYLAPEHITLIGIRSYEPGEAALLSEQGVRIYTIEEVQDRTFKVVFEEAMASLAEQVDHFGITLDLDGFDPEFAPGVGSPAENGLNPAEVLPVLKDLRDHPQLAAFELVELNPDRDIDSKTERLIYEILCAVFGS